MDPAVGTFSRYAENLLTAMNGGIPLHKVYGIGDNPETDIAGANNGNKTLGLVAIRGCLPVFHCFGGRDQLEVTGAPCW
jgi:hypothetical protein